MRTVRPPGWLPRSSYRGWPLTPLAAALFVGVFLLRRFTPDPADASVVLYTLPVVLIAVRFGIRGGVMAALLSCVLTLVWMAWDEPELGLGGVAIRFTVFLFIGVTMGLLAERVSSAAVERRRLQEVVRHRDQRALKTEVSMTRLAASERRASLLADVGAVLASAAESAERMQRVLDLLVPSFADFGTIESVDGYGLDLLAAAHADPALLPALRRVRRRHPFDLDDRWGLTDAIWEGRPRLVPGGQDDQGDEIPVTPESEIPSERRPRSLMILPLKARGLVIAGLCLARLRPEREFDEADLALAELIAGRVALALDNAQLYEEQRDVASALQHALLPDELPKVPGVTATAHYQAGEAVLDVGGDWYDMIRLPEGRVGVVLGDVVGSGVLAAATMGRLRSAVAALAPHCSGPAELLTRVDGFATSVTGARLATAVYADFDPSTGRLRYACAGHPPPLLMTDDGRVTLLRGGRSVPLATDTGLPRSEDEIMVDRGAVLVCYSDGLVERRGVDVDSRLERLLVAAEERKRAGLEELREGLLSAMVGDQGFDDDVALLCLRLEPVRPARFHEVIPARCDQLASLRSRLRRWALAGRLDQRQTADLLLAVGEACANTIEHAYLGHVASGHVEISAELASDGMIVVQVSDTGRWRSQSRAIAHRGRGLVLMRAIMRAVEIDSNPAGTTVTMRMPRGETGLAAVKPPTGGGGGRVGRS